MWLKCCSRVGRVVCGLIWRLLNVCCCVLVRWFVSFCSCVRWILICLLLMRVVLLLWMCVLCCSLGCRLVVCVFLIICIWLFCFIWFVLSRFGCWLVVVR